MPLFGVPLKVAEGEQNRFGCDVNYIAGKALCLCWEFFAQTTDSLWRRYGDQTLPFYLSCTLFDAIDVCLGEETAQLPNSPVDVTEPYRSPRRPHIELSDFLLGIAQIRAATKRIMDALWNAFGLEECPYFDAQGQPRG